MEISFGGGIIKKEDLGPVWHLTRFCFWIMFLKWEIEIIRFISIYYSLKSPVLDFELFFRFFKFDFFLIGLTALSFILSSAHLTMYIESHFAQFAFLISSACIILLSAVIGNVISVGSFIAGMLILIIFIRIRRKDYWTSQS